MIIKLETPRDQDRITEIPDYYTSDHIPMVGDNLDIHYESVNSKRNDIILRVTKVLHRIIPHPYTQSSVTVEVIKYPYPRN